MDSPANTKHYIILSFYFLQTFSLLVSPFKFHFMFLPLFFIFIIIFVASRNKYYINIFLVHTNGTKKKAERTFIKSRVHKSIRKRQKGCVSMMDETRSCTCTASWPSSFRYNLNTKEGEHFTFKYLALTRINRFSWLRWNWIKNLKLKYINICDFIL